MKAKVEYESFIRRAGELDVELEEYREFISEDSFQRIKKHLVDFGQSMACDYMERYTWPLVDFDKSERKLVAYEVEYQTYKM